MAMPVRGVFELPKGSGIWWINFYVEGQRHREKVGSRSNAIKLYQRRKSDALAGIKLPDTLRTQRAILFKELAVDALAYSVAHKKTHRQDASYLNTMLPVFGFKKADEIGPADIGGYLSSRTDLKPATLNRYRSLLSMVFQEGIRNGKVKTNPARLVRLRREDNARIRFLTMKEEALIRTVILDRSPSHEPAFTVALETGMRLSEQHKLTWSQVDMARRQILLTQTKNGCARPVMLTPKAIAALEACLARRDASTDRVFLSRYGAPLDSPVAWFRLVMKDVIARDPALGDVTWHIFRHTFISRCVMAGMDLRSVQEAAGHKDISMTIRYAHLSPDHKRDAINMLSKYRQQQEDQMLSEGRQIA